MVRSFPGMHYSVSYTTRPPRPGDENGRDYHFISPEEFQGRIECGDFAEWAEIYGHRYGTSRSQIGKILGEGRDVILDIDGQGARQLKNGDLGGVFVFILPPSLAELRRRLALRGTEAGEARNERLRQARAEMAAARGYDYLVVNDDLEKAADRLRAVILAEHQRRPRMEDLLEGLLREEAELI